MRTNIRFIITAIVLMVTAGFSSCSGFLKEYSQDLAKVESWKDLDEVLLGDCYMHSGRIYSSKYAYYMDKETNLDILHLMGDEMIEYPMSYQYSDICGYVTETFGFYTWQQDTGVNEKLTYSGGDSKYWDMLYDRINVANMVISLIDEQPETSTDDHLNKQRVKGEAHFLRAAYYFILVNLYAKPYAPSTAATDKGVPVKLTEYVEDTEFERLSVADTYAQILSDLSVAEQNLDGKGRKSIYHADATAACLLMSRVYLYMQDWDKAAEYARKVLDEQSSLLDLHSLSAGEDCLYKDSPETIFSMGDYLISAVFADASYYDPTYTLSDEIVSLYEDNDLRSSLYVGKTYYNRYSNCFMKVNGQRNKWGSYHEVSSSFLMRTPEAYLNLAEAAAYKGDEETAKSTLKQFLATRMEGQFNIDETGDDLIQFIREERARELLLEGHRWFDLRRYTVNTVLPWSKTIEHSHYYYDNFYIDYVDWYRLEEYDAAYTLPIPREVRNFQISLGNNERPERNAFKTE